MNLVRAITQHLKTPPRTRIAPTPSGYLHLGNAMNFLLIAAVNGLTSGTVSLRIDDLDSQRARAEFLADIFDQLKWLGIKWTEGPHSLAEFAGYSQSLKPSYYTRQIENLPRSMVFACRCSRSEIQNQSSSGIYPGTCRHLGLSLEDPENSIRVRAQGAVTFQDLLVGQVTVQLESDVGDFVIRRKGGEPSYQWVSILEDLEQRMDLIIRGEDLLNSTAQQLYLAELLGKETHQIRWAHHKLIPGPGGQKLSKSGGALSLRQIRQQGGSVDSLYGQFLEWTGGRQSSSPQKKPKTFQELLALLT